MNRSSGAAATASSASTPSPAAAEGHRAIRHRPVASAERRHRTRALLPALPRWGAVLAVGAHPDDESFGMGAVLAAFADAGARIVVLSFTHGEASTLHGVLGDLASVREAELTAAGRVLGVARSALLDYPDGRLAEQSLPELIVHVREMTTSEGVDGLLAFDEGGITSHPDHRTATEAALAAADQVHLPVLGWAIPLRVAGRLNAEFGTAFVGREDSDLDVGLAVDRGRQLRAIAEHRSQSAANPVLWRRLELLGDREWLRWLRPRAPSG
jgi:N-acetylglucosamine malate deacetylase 2